MFSPPVSACTVCGEQFVTASEWEALNSTPSEVLIKMLERRREHYAVVYFTEHNSSYPTRTSSVISLHAAVRKILQVAILVTNANCQRNLNL